MDCHGLRRGWAAALFAAACFNIDLQGAAAQSALGTSDQIAAEKTVLRLLHDASLKDAQDKLRRDIQVLGSAAMHNAANRLENGIQMWTAGMLLRHIAADPAAVKFLWIYDETPHTWAGFTFPGNGCCGGNPDQIYRVAFLDGNAQYEITGKVAAPKPIQISFEAFHGQPGTKVDKPRQGPDVGKQISFLRDEGLKVAEDGSFRITVGGTAPTDGSPHMRLEPGMVELTVREVLSDWAQLPTSLAIRRVSGGATPLPLSDGEILQRTAADLPSFAVFWVGAFDRWVGPEPANTVVGPVPRDGGWGYLSDVHYKLAEDEALIITMERANADYIGLHITDPWTIVPDNRLHQTSLNQAQAIAAADGSITYTIAPKDPGVANWIDTAGMREGYVVLRWIGTPPGTRAERLVRRITVVKNTPAALAAADAGPTMTKDARRAQLARRAADHARRYTN